MLSADSERLSLLCTCSPAEAWDVFVRARVSQAQWEKHAADLMASADLMCRIGGALYPWGEAASHLEGSVAFGTSWQGACLGQGVPVALPPRRENSASAAVGSKVSACDPPAMPLHAVDVMLSWRH